MVSFKGATSGHPWITKWVVGALELKGAVVLAKRNQSSIDLPSPAVMISLKVESVLSIWMFIHEFSG